MTNGTRRRDEQTNRGTTRTTGRWTRRMNKADEKAANKNKEGRHMTQRAGSKRDTSCGSQYVAEGHGDGLKRFNR